MIYNQGHGLPMSILLPTCFPHHGSGHVYTLSYYTPPTTACRYSHLLQGIIRFNVIYYHHILSYSNNINGISYFHIILYHSYSKYRRLSFNILVKVLAHPSHTGSQNLSSNLHMPLSSAYIRRIALPFSVRKGLNTPTCPYISYFLVGEFVVGGHIIYFICSLTAVILL